MKCLDPYLHFRRDKRIVRYQFSIARNQVIIRGSNPFLVTDCLKCTICNKKRARELANRCVLGASLHLENCFLTLTYDETKTAYHNNFEYRDVQLFKKTLRSYVTRNCNGRKIQIFNVHEYGKNGKKHWHLIVFGFNYPDRVIHTYSNSLPLSRSEQLSLHWPHGLSSIGDVSEASAMYQAQYLEKDQRNGHSRKGPKRSHSKHSGIGRDFFLANYNQILRLGYIPFAGQKMPIPRYFQRLAEKHYAHYYEPALFFDTPDRKARFRIFKERSEKPETIPNREIADLYLIFKETKQIIIQEHETKFKEVLQLWQATKEDPDFVRSGSNVLYDLNNKQKSGDF